jgi:hypothetical protein
MPGEPDHLEVTLNFAKGAEPITGSLTDPAGRRQYFCGWLELMEELQRSVAHSDEVDGDAAETDTAPPDQTQHRRSQ